MDRVNETPTIRIVRKKQVHAAHHGGSWKVAYADFVTAMMAFFLVMWLVSLDDNIKIEIQNYFNDPFSASATRSGITKMAAGGSSPIASGFFGVMNHPSITGTGGGGSAMSPETKRFAMVQDRLERQLHAQPDLKDLEDHVRLQLGTAGLVIELKESDHAAFFESGSAVVPPKTREILAIIAKEVGKLPNPVHVEGHTDSVPYHASGYSNWELSTDRANAARRVMEGSGLRSGQVTQVRGYADSQPRDPAHPELAGNRRVTIVVAYLGKENDEGSEGTPEGMQGLRDTHGKPFTVDIRPDSP